MGVPGLWTLLEPARRPVELEQLSGKVVAIDMNIWLHQAVKSRAANDGPRTYLGVLFRRLCKLIYFGIRAVFVFDGEVPALKRATMTQRRKLRSQLGDRAQRAQERLLRRLLRRVAETSIVKLDVSTEGKSTVKENNAKLELIRRLHQRPDVQQAAEDAELFSAPVESSLSGSDSGGLLHEKAGLEYDDLARDYLDGFNLDAVGTGVPELDLHSDAFCALPLQAQLRVVQLARDQLYAHSHVSRSAFANEGDLQDVTTESFSNHQIGRLLLRRRLAERHEQLSADLAREEAAKQVARLNNPRLTTALSSRVGRHRGEAMSNSDEHTPIEMCTTALRIQSQDTGHAILIKTSPLKSISDRTGSGTMGSKMTLESLIELVNRAQEQDENETKLEVERTNSSSHSTSANSSVCSTDVMVESHSDMTPIKGASKVLPDDPSIPGETNVAVESSYFQDLQQALPVANRKTSDENETDVNRSPISGVAPCELKPTMLPRGTEDFTIFQATSPDSLPCQNLPNRKETDRQVEKTTELKESDAPSSSMKESVQTDESTEEDADDFIDVPVVHKQSSEPAKQKVDQANLSTDSTSSETEDEKNANEEIENPSEPLPVSADDWIEGVGDDEDEEEFKFDDDVLREEADRFARQAQTTTTKCITEAQELLQLFGMPFVISPEEAEAQCVTLQRNSLVDLVASDDSDVWPFGAMSVCRHLFGGTDNPRSKSIRPNTKQRSPSCYSLDDVQSTLGLNVANLLRLAMLCGSDYTPGIRNVGPVTAVEILSEFTRQASTEAAQDEVWARWLRGKVEAPEDLVAIVIEPLKQFVDWWHSCGSKSRTIQTTSDPKLVTSPVRRKWLNLNPPPGFPDPRIIQAYLRPNVKTDLGTFKWETPNVELLVKHAHAVLGWPRDRTEAMLSAVLKRQEQRALTATSLVHSRLITHYFTKSVPPVAAPSELKRETEMLDAPDEVTLPSKRARKATSHLRPRTISDQSEQGIIHTSYEQTENRNLSELPCHASRHSSSKRPPKAKSNRGKVSRKSALKGSTRRRVVSRVALSEDDESDSAN